MKKKLNVKVPALKLAKDTLRSLSNADLRKVAGGDSTGSGIGCNASTAIPSGHSFQHE